ncbi:hypothetical protein [Nocardia bovistercoris]|uniref:hypothetical protein n=1 Tax=Nocardia bovistercoris TaxID=2785916 RepID=UPI001E29892B|nr:hypothetical protein [Nocardia bovistercoris]
MGTATDEKTTSETTDTDDAAREASPPPGARTVSIRLSTVVTGVVIAALVISTVVFAVLYFSAESTLSDRDQVAADDKHAEEIASSYALGASTIDYRDVNAWLGRLKTGTTPQLSAKFDATGPQLEQILLPLQWNSTATPLSAQVLSESGGVYKVNAYLNVNSTSAQNPAGGQTTVTYSLTIDRNANWQISDVGGLQNAIGGK